MTQEREARLRTHPFLGIGSRLRRAHVKGRPDAEEQSMSSNTNANKADKAQKSGWWETVKVILQALAIAMVVRVFFYQPFNIPSGSMKETLLVGDYLFVSKLAYGYSKYSFPRHTTLCLPMSDACETIRILPDLISEGRVFSAAPERGDVAVFKLPRDKSTDYIKRVIGLPGDEIMMRDGVLHINGKAVPKVPSGEYVAREEDAVVSIPAFRETLPNGVTYTVLDSEPAGPFDNVGPYKVPAGHYFMMGDNRDNSTDSRALWGVGYVPVENFIGRAEIVFFSAAVDDPDSFRLFAPWTWPLDIRWRRFFDLVR